MELGQTPTGRFINGKEIVAVKLQNKAGTIVNIFNYGLIINRFLVKNKQGAMQDIVLGFDSVDGYLTPGYLADYPYLGAVIGRYANRISHACFQIEGVTYELAKNNGPVCLHGGMSGFDRKVWEVLPGNNEVTFKYNSPDGEEGFPGNLGVLVRLKLTEENELVFDYEAQTDKATAINLTHHSYFNLDKAGGNIASHIHTMPASFYLEQDDDFAATGRLCPVKGTGWDFTMAKPIGRDWLPGIGYDQSFVLDKAYGALSLASSTTNAAGTLTLDILTTEPVAHFYTSRYLNVKNAKGEMDHRPFEAFCIETQHHPNAVNVPGFPDTILRKGGLYRQTTVYKLS